MRVWPAKDCGRDTHGDYRFLYSTAGTLFLTKNLDYAFSHKTYSDSPSFKGEKRSKQESRNKSTFLRPIKHRASPILGLLSFTPPPKATHLVGLDWIDH